MALQEHDASARPQIPDACVGVQTAAGRQGTILIKFDVEHGSRMSFLMENLLAGFQIPESPGLIVTSRAEKTTRWMPRQTGYAVGGVT